MTSKPWMCAVLYLAGVYNITWGTIVALFPNELFLLAGMEVPKYPALFQCIGMMIAVFGAAYLAAGHNPIRHWPIVFAGLLGRILGPIGFAYGLMEGTFTLKAGITILTNDLIWIIPFAMILWAAYRHAKQ
ncbi:hypothetical protein VQ643_15525 [Pseudomonas sp. F1_0610]|uniref:hypothetical protein n=1 Tax=Pseudomonas sp. F1_0610 TaxID=3114284 RepID=UPI0039C2057E